MSFNCYFCSKTTKPGEKQHLITTRIRNVNYPNGSRGVHIVSEKPCCEACWLSGETLYPVEVKVSETFHDGPMVPLIYGRTRISGVRDV